MESESGGEITISGGDAEAVMKLDDVRQLPLKSVKLAIGEELEKNPERPIFVLREVGSTRSKVWTQFLLVIEKPKGVEFFTQVTSFVACKSFRALRALTNPYLMN